MVSVVYFCIQFVIDFIFFRVSSVTHGAFFYTYIESHVHVLVCERTHLRQKLALLNNTTIYSEISKEYSIIVRYVSSNKTSKFW